MSLLYPPSLANRPVDTLGRYRRYHSKLRLFGYFLAGRLAEFTDSEFERFEGDYRRLESELQILGTRPISEFMQITK